MKRSIGSTEPATKLSHHIRELQTRLFVSVIGLCLAGVVIYNFYEPILSLLRGPLDAPLYYSTPGGSFALIMKVCLMGSLAITIPVLVYNLIMFVRPAFEKFITKKRVYATSAASALLAMAGAAFGFIFIIPGSLHFFAGFQVEGLSALISADSYLTLVTNVIITFMLVFQLPLLISFIDSVKPLQPKSLFKLNRWVILGSLVVSLMVPFAFDFMTSIMIATPIVLLYNLSIAIVAMQHALSKRQRSATTRAPVTYDARDLVLASAPSLSLNDQLAANFVEEPTRHMEPAPAAFHPPAPQRRTTSDILQPTSPSAAVSKPAFKPKNVTLASRVRIISDIAPRQRPSRALTSQ